MKRIFSLFSRLLWKLTLSYMLVTVAAILLVEIILLGVVGYLIYTSPILGTAISASLRQIATEQLVPMLETDPPDRQAMQDWITSVRMQGGLHTTGSSNVSFNFNGLDPVLIAITDKDGNLLAADPQGELIPDRPLASQLKDPQAVDVLKQALAGQLSPENLSGRGLDKTVISAVPLIGTQGGVQGGLLVILALPTTATALFSQTLKALLQTGLIISIFAAVVGIIFGLLISQGLSRRLVAVSRAADSWSRGDFSVYVRDRSGDEIGQLARRLNRMAEQLQNLVQSRRELASLEERNRLARDLHDSVKQQVFATVMQIGAARELVQQDPENAQAHLAEAERLARQAQQELAVLIRELRPAALEGKGLAQALREYVRDWSQQAGIQAELHVQGERGLPLGIEQGLFRIAQEALSNVARHSQASQAEISLMYEAGQVQICVEDNGQGFEQGQAGSVGFGLSSMSERAQALGGELKVESQPGQGTSVTASLPMEDGDER